MQKLPSTVGVSTQINTHHAFGARSQEVTNQVSRPLQVTEKKWTLTTEPQNH